MSFHISNVEGHKVCFAAKSRSTTCLFLGLLLLISDSAWDGIKLLAIKHLAYFWLSLAQSKLSFRVISSLAWAPSSEFRWTKGSWVLNGVQCPVAPHSRFSAPSVNILKSLDVRPQQSPLGRAGMGGFTWLSWPFTPPPCNISNDEPSWVRRF